MNKIPAQIYTKTTDAGDSKCVIIPAFTRFVAKLNIPNWKAIRVLYCTSITDAGELNAVPPYALYTTPRYATDKKYVGGIGLMSQPDANPGDLNSYGYWIGGTMNPDGNSNHGSRLMAGNAFGQRDLVSWSSSGQSGFWVNGDVTEITAGSGANLTITTAGRKLAASAATTAQGGFEESQFAQRGGVECTRSALDTTVAKKVESAMATDASLLALTNAGNDNTIARGSLYTKVTTDAPLGETPYLVIQWPFVDADLRLHAWHVEVIEEQL